MGDSYLLSPTERDSSGHFECPRNISSSLWVDGGKLQCFLPWKPAILASQPPFSLPYHYSISANVYPSRKSAGLYSGKSSEPPLHSSRGFYWSFPLVPTKWCLRSQTMTWNPLSKLVLESHYIGMMGNSSCSDHRCHRMEGEAGGHHTSIYRSNELRSMK